MLLNVLYASEELGSILRARGIVAAMSRVSTTPLGTPLPCIEWQRGIANPLGQVADKLGCIAAVKDWVRHIIRRNKELKINVTASSDPLMLDIRKARKNTLPDVESLCRHLNAIRCGIDMDFPELATPASACSTPE